MTFAWYAHLKNHSATAVGNIAVIVQLGDSRSSSTCCAGARPNRIGFRAALSLGQLKVLQEVITCFVFVHVCRRLHEGSRSSSTYLWAGLCLLGRGCITFFRS
jgi:uncharacterized protein (DUF486 family)